MTSSPISPEKQFGISMRYRSEQTNVEDVQEENCLLTPIGIQQIDNQLPILRQLTRQLRETQIELQNVTAQFINSISGTRTDDMQTALIRLKDNLEMYAWRLERNKRYRMQLRLLNSNNHADQTTLKSVQQFNQINERCADQIGLAKELKLKIVQYLSILEAAGNESQSNLISENHATSLNINTNFLDPCNETGDNNINRQIQTLRVWQANLNSARLLSKEADLAMQKGRKLFNELLNNCAHCLFQTDGRD
ncbi:hypothetical protein EG68_05596 [Paragonimus skrjabini miyazakii]|uniref:Uncharacterized protein n=1 Tax=Paragonimus skrjabini miyazakii TaxID=59628 RepID=A0A8S9YUW1_9TREM|nr:hypothetical protein EG68_05596 [Paragonimus skrjabini miyazakii]